MKFDRRRNRVGGKVRGVARVFFFVASKIEFFCWLSYFPQCCKWFSVIKTRGPLERNISLISFPALLWNRSIFSQRNHLNYNKFFMFYADQILSLFTPPPSLTLIHIINRNQGNFLFFYFQFSFVRYSIYIIYGVIIQKRSWRWFVIHHCVLCTPLGILYLV